MSGQGWEKRNDETKIQRNKVKHKWHVAPFVKAWIFLEQEHRDNQYWYRHDGDEIKFSDNEGRISGTKYRQLITTKHILMHSMDPDMSKINTFLLDPYSTVPIDKFTDFNHV